MAGKSAQFFVGEVIHHKLFDYRGVIVDVDPEYSGTEEWYAQMARSRPPRDEPWYHVLVHNATHTTYVAERNLETDTSGEQILHPKLGDHFDRFDGSRYLTISRSN
jgi:heat shock protein HspQ